VIKDSLYSQKLLHFEFILLVGFSFLGLFLLCASYDFLSLYLALELQSLSFYLLAAFKYNSDYSTESGLKYFVTGSFTSGILLFGICLLYLGYGSISFEVISNLFAASTDILDIVVLGYFFVLVALLFKLGAVPFHLWLPDTYEGAPLPVTFLFATVPKIALFYVTLKLTLVVFSFNNGVIENLLAFSAVGSIIVAALMALYQKKLKRLIAFSAISHTGFILLGLCSTSLTACKVSAFYITIYCAIGVCLFSLIIITAVDMPLLKYLVN
jgi:NADH-quinone oxidoreductase subunit N